MILMRVDGGQLRAAMGAAVAYALAASAIAGAEITVYRLRSPSGEHALEQASGLDYGRLGTREGLWLVCDRNAGRSSGGVYFFSAQALARAQDGGDLSADEVFRIALPSEPWPVFAEHFHGAGREVLEDVRRRIGADGSEPDVRPLDLEAVAIGRAPAPPHGARLFVVAEQPRSAVLELRLDNETRPPLARLAGVYSYHEAENEHGWDLNDGLEGLAQAGEAGHFFWAEEGTRSHSEERVPRLMFRDPRLGRCELRAGQLVIDDVVSPKLTQAVRNLRTASMQTLNGLAVTHEGNVLAVDRNGGWILEVDPKRGQAAAWLNLYDLEGVNLRETLADFPGRRRMPYISIEGIAVDAEGTLWLVDDPAMPEAFHESCLVRIRGARPPGGP